jgi:hypothetical protein
MMRLLLDPPSLADGALPPVMTRDSDTSSSSLPPAVNRWNAPVNSTPISPRVVSNLTGANVNMPPAGVSRTV